MRILFVDAGNYCRSPAAEAVMTRLVAEAGLADRVIVASAGLKDKHAGQPADPRTVRACEARGYDLSDFRAREIEPEDFLRSDLILAMDRENLAALLDRRPAGTNPDIRLFLDGAEVPDPYFGGEDGFAAMMDQIEEGARALLADLRRHG